MARLRTALPNVARRQLAEKYGCAPGYIAMAGCYWCGQQGRIYWHRLSSGKPSHWVSFDHDIDHLIPIAKGGSHDVSNLVLACEACNARRGSKDAAIFMRAA